MRACFRFYLFAFYIALFNPLGLEAFNFSRKQ